MRISSVFVPFLVLAAGIAGYILRFAELTIVFDSTTGLPARDAMITYALSGLTLLVFLLSLILP